ncbi:MAG: hypothetical protein EXR79_15550 [Myxococcales bacterium]|nr:hypothetical protein [Myxococcales bacterium]
MTSQRTPDAAAGSLARHEAWLAALVLATFGVVGYGVHHTYPFFAFDMFTRPDSVVSERLAARLADGSLREVTALTAWHCPGLPSVGLVPDPAEVTPACRVRDVMDSQERRALAHIRSHADPAAGAVSVQLVRRVWRMPLPGDTGAEYDCPLLACRAVLHDSAVLPGVAP